MHAQADTVLAWRHHPAAAKIGVVLVAVVLVLLPFALTGIGTRGCASRTSRSCSCCCRSASTSSSASRACSTWATSRSTRWARTCYALLASPHFGLHLPVLGDPAGRRAGGLPVRRAARHADAKLRGDYLAIVTLGFGEIIRIFLNNLSQPVNITNGRRASR
jgi:branched-chain amino acid transport system permease protein